VQRVLQKKWWNLIGYGYTIYVAGASKRLQPVDQLRHLSQI